MFLLKGTREDDSFMYRNAVGVPDGYMIFIQNYSDRTTQREVEEYIKNDPSMEDNIFTIYVIGEGGELKKMVCMPKKISDPRPSLPDYYTNQKFVTSEITEGDIEMIDIVLSKMEDGFTRTEPA